LVYKNRMVRAVVKKNAETLSIEVVLVGDVHRKISAGQDRIQEQVKKEETDYDSPKHNSD
jgi:hypothetical protein